jgi:hypothetical protein
MKPTKQQQRQQQQRLDEAKKHIRAVLDSIDPNEFMTVSRRQAVRAAEEFLKQEGERK